jgi:hypothetical protein
MRFFIDRGCPGRLDCASRRSGALRALRADIEIPSFDRRSSQPRGARHLNGHFGRLTLAVLFSLTLTLAAPAETVAETARKWGLIGTWSLDCSLAPDRNRDTLLTYQVASGERVVHRRNFGDTSDESEVVTAVVSGDGMLNLRVFFPALKQTREYGVLAVVYLSAAPGPIRWHYRRKINAMMYQAIIE